MTTVEVQLRIRRTTGWREYTVQVPPEAYVLDAIEAAEAQDASLLFRHSCHHASCGSCGMRINGREKLACITTVAQVSDGKRAIRIEPLRNFPIIGDLLVDMGAFLRKLDTIGMPVRRGAEQSGFNRFENCIECGLCVSACPIAGRDEHYAGPALLAAAGRVVAEPRGRDAEAVLRQVDEGHGVWRCHAAFECSEVCPPNVDPAREIMGLRSRLLRSGAKGEV
jgi:succinate dehydrogenase / fumarate reductase iron-sulfur subunit